MLAMNCITVKTYSPGAVPVFTITLHSAHHMERFQSHMTHPYGNLEVCSVF